MGSGGGGGTLYLNYTGNPHGGNGGGMLVIEVDYFECNGTITVNGADGSSNEMAIYSSGGGGGSGGSIFINCIDAFSNRGKITAEGGKGGNCVVGAYPGIAGEGGNGGNGRIRISVFGSKPYLGDISPPPFVLSAPLPQNK